MMILYITVCSYYSVSNAVHWKHSLLCILCNFPSDLQSDQDRLFEDNQVRILVDKKSLLYLLGTTLEYSGGLNGKGFIFNNPNAQRTCGCGESFTL